MKKSIYIYSQGQLKRKDNTLTFIDQNDVKRDIPIESVSEINIMTEVNFNTSLINILNKNNILVHFFNYYDYYIGSFYPRESLCAGELLVKQVNYYTEKEKRLEISKCFVTGAMENIYRNIRYYNSRGRNLDEILNKIRHIKENVNDCSEINELMGYEGSVRKLYYSCWNDIVNKDVDFKKRVMHPPDNEINTLISYVNMLIYTKVLSEVYLTQLDPTISYLHEPGFRRFSLCLDISEIFKPLIGDRLIFSLLNKNQINEKSFVKTLNGLHLKKEASALISRSLDERLKTTIMHKDLKKKVSYKYLIRLECYKLIKHLLAEKPYEPFVIWW